MGLGNYFNRWQLYILCIGWLAYASTYLLRKPLGVIKVDLQKELNLSTSQLGLLDTALILPYAIVQMVLGSVGDKFGAGITHGVALIISGVSMITFGSWTSFYVLMVLLFLNGASQSLCWPNGSKVIASWFSGPSKKTIFGVYGTSAFAGGIVGTSLTVYLMSNYDGWRSCFFLPSAILIVMGIIVFTTFHESKETVSTSDASQPAVQHSAKGETSWAQILNITLVPEVSLSVFCLKLIRYCLYMWLPMYLHQDLHYTKVEAGMFSTMFEIGGVAGSAFVGVAINRFFYGRCIQGCMVMMFLSTVMLALFMVTASWGATINSVLMALAGVFNCGPDSILVGLVPTELGEKGGRKAGAAVTGFVNGFGSVGSVVQGPVIGAILGITGWSGMFYFMIVLSSFGTVALFRGAAVEKREAMAERKSAISPEV